MRIIGDETTVLPKRFALIVGNARSGTTIIGSIVDAHPRMICGNETNASQRFWRGLERDDIVREIVDNSVANADSGRPSFEYRYAIPTPDKDWRDIDVIADKVWNPSLLLMHGDRTLLPQLAERMGTQVLLVHCIRHPLDVIATMHRRSAASLRDRMRWYFMHCEAVQALVERNDAPLAHFAHEQLIASPDVEIPRLCDFLGVPAAEDYVRRCRQVMFREVKTTRDGVSWPDDILAEIRQRASHYDFLRGYDLASTA
jgi:sulfotransferase family protein